MLGVVLGNDSTRGDTPASAGSVKRWITEIDADDYSVREQATKCLAAAGAAAVNPLQQAAVGKSPEASWRSLQALGEMADSVDDATLSTAAETALFAIRDQAAGLAASTARDILRHHAVVRQQQAKAEIQRLGGDVRLSRLNVEMQEQVQVILDDEWRGGNAGLQQLTRLGDFELLCIWSLRLDDEAVAMLMKLRGVNKIQLYGSGLDEKTAQKIAAATGATVDWRKGALLGIGPMPGVPGCRVSTVQPGSAAEKAGIVTGDLIVKFDGAEVTDFDSLTKEIAKKEPKETATIVVQRNDPVETLTLKATLGRWQLKSTP